MKMPITADGDVKLAIFRKILITEFFSEYNFYGNVVAGRAEARKVFLDKASEKFSLGLSVALSGVDAFAPGASKFTKITALIDYANDARREQRAKSMGTFYDQALVNEEEEWLLEQDKLRILLEQVAREAAYRYEYAIVHLLADDPATGIIPLARDGVERMLEFMLRTQADLKEENFLRGLIEGRSGAYVTNFFNTALATKELAEDESNYTAQGIFGRSGMLDPAGNPCYRDKPKHSTVKDHIITLTEIKKNIEALEKEVGKDLNSKNKWKNFKGFLKNEFWKVLVTKKITEAQLKKFRDAASAYGYVRFKENKKNHDKDAKYGYVNLPVSWTMHYGFEQRIPSKADKELLERYKPMAKVVSAATIGKYIKDNQQRIAQGQPSRSLNAYVSEQFPGTKIAICHADLTSLPSLEGGDFTGSDLSGCCFKGSLRGVIFRKTYLVDAKFEDVVDARDADFSHAHMEYIEAPGADFTNADFSGAHLNYGDLQGATLNLKASFDTKWHGTNLKDIKVLDPSFPEKLAQQQKTDKAELLKLIKEQNKKYKELKNRLDKQAEILEGLANKVSEHFSKLDTKVQEQSNEISKILFQLSQEQSMRLLFEEYCKEEFTDLREELSEEINVLKKQFDDTKQIQSTAIEEVTQQIKNLITDKSSNEVQLTAKLQALGENLEQLRKSQTLQMAQVCDEIKELKIKVNKLEEELKMKADEKQQETKPSQRPKKWKTTVHGSEKNTPVAVLEGNEVSKKSLQNLSSTKDILQNLPPDPREKFDDVEEDIKGDRINAHLYMEIERTAKKKEEETEEQAEEQTEDSLASEQKKILNSPIVAPQEQVETEQDRNWTPTRYDY